MRTFLFIGLLCTVGLATGTAQDPAPLTEPAHLQLTPAEVELIMYYLDLRTAELDANPHDFGRIWRKYDDLIRRALPAEKFRLALPLMGC